MAARGALRIAVLSGVADRDAQLHADAVTTAGGSFSTGLLRLNSAFFRGEKNSGCFQNTDDYWSLLGENTTQALISMKQLRLATAVNAPTFTPSRGYTFNGTNQYINSNFVPITHTLVMSPTSARMALYSRTDATVGSAAGSLAAGSTDHMVLRPRTAANVCTTFTIVNTASWTLPSGTAVGYTAGSRQGSSIFAYKDGVALAPISAGGLGALLPNGLLLFGGQTGPSGLWAGQLSFVTIGAAFTAAQELSQYNRLQALASALGAQV